MYDRAERLLTRPLDSTVDHVGPGSYHVNTVNPKLLKTDGYAPFLSMTSRDSCLNPADSVIAAPGPGQYDIEPAPVVLKGCSSLANKAERFKRTLSETPGPGTYYTKKEWQLTQKAATVPLALPQSEDRDKACSLIVNRNKFHRGPMAPSIPTPGQAYGYEENDDGTLRKQPPPSKDASMGPAYYKVNTADTQTSVDYHGVFFGKKTGRREGIMTTVGPGPGEYEPYYMPETIAIENSNMKQTDKTFEASVPRYHEQIVLNEAKRGVPGPGRYDVRGQFEQRSAVVNMDGIEVEHPPFLSQARRFQPIKNDHPAPGAYNDPRTALEAMKRVTGLKRSPFGQTSIRFMRDHELKTPGPGAYNMHGMGSDSMRRAYMESSRRGAFGSTAVRIQAMMARPELEQPGPAHYQLEPAPVRRRQPLHTTANFTSHTRRLPDTYQDVPAPGSYNVAQAYDKSQQRNENAPPRTDVGKRRQGAFKSSSNRFCVPTGVVINEADPNNPGPGMYNPLLKGHVGNMMGNHDARFKTILRDEIPGPGTYEFSPLIQDSVLKTTFNTTLNNPLARDTQSVSCNTYCKQPFTLEV